MMKNIIVHSLFLLFSFINCQNLTPHLLSCMKFNGIQVESILNDCNGSGLGGPCCHWFYSSSQNSGMGRRSRSFESETTLKPKQQMIDPPKYVNTVVTPNEDGQMFINIESKLGFKGGEKAKNKGSIYNEKEDNHEFEYTTSSPSSKVYYLKKSYVPYDSNSSPQTDWNTNSIRESSSNSEFFPIMKKSINNYNNPHDDLNASSNVKPIANKFNSFPPQNSEFEEEVNNIPSTESNLKSNYDSFAHINTDDMRVIGNNFIGLTSESKSHTNAPLQTTTITQEPLNPDYYNQVMSQKAIFNEILKNNLEHTRIKDDTNILHRIEDPSKDQNQDLSKELILMNLLLKRNLNKESQKKTQSKRIQFTGGQRRGIVVPGAKDDHSKLLDQNQNKEKGFSKAICLELKVPCRFVVDHPCCLYEMPMDLVARARSMDGSADLIWRSSSPYVTRARSLSGFSKNYPSRRGRHISYDFATSRSGVRTPKYSFDGYGLEITSNLIGNCWRIMQNINCSITKDHPCCLLSKKPSGPPTLDRVSRWIQNS
uniref:Uncharacterized protein n=1 Tax=Lepeophtheirus salmonis TaxID=72036 RepID=A0A0K2VHW5_LEPSM